MDVIEKLYKEENVAIVIKSQSELDYLVEKMMSRFNVSHEDFDFVLLLQEGKKLILIKDVKIRSINLENCFNLGYDIIHLSVSIPDSQYPIQYMLEINAEGSKEEISDALILISKDILQDYSQEIVGGEYLDGVATLEIFEPIFRDDKPQR